MNAIEEIEKLAKLRDRGVLTDEEFKELKAYTLSLDDSHPPAKQESSANTVKPESEPVSTAHKPEHEHKPKPEHIDIQQPIEEPKPAEITKTDTNNVKPYANTVATEPKPQTQAPSGNKWLLGIARVIVCCRLHRAGLLVCPQWC